MAKSPSGLRYFSLAASLVDLLNESLMLQLLHLARVHGVETAPVEAAGTNHSQPQKDEFTVHGSCQIFCSTP